VNSYLASSLAVLIELLGTTARLTALAAQPDTIASRTLQPLSITIKQLYLELTAHFLLSCILVVVSLIPFERARD
jgi:hypothetical protein